jgi:tetratricopeptide (TPR) repeat protein
LAAINKWRGRERTIEVERNVAGRRWFICARQREGRLRREVRVKRNGKIWSAASIIAIGTFCLAGIAAGQGASASRPAASSNSNSTTLGKDKSPLNPENSLELVKPADKSEQVAFDKFQAVSPENSRKKIELGEAFLQKYPASRYRASIYSDLTSAYLQTNQVPRMLEAGEKALALNPKNVQVLAMLGQTIPRVITANTPDPEAEMAKAEQYSKRAIETMPTIPKPDNMSDAQFAQAKNQTLAIAHSGLGLADFHRGDFAGAVMELEQSVKLDPRADPVNYYVLGVANVNASHFHEAVEAFIKCAEFPGSLQQTCKDNMDKAKALGAAQPAAPK